MRVSACRAELLLLAIVGLVIGSVALAPMASASQRRADDCAVRPTSEEIETSSFALNGERLLVRDGAGFFSLEDRDAIAIRPSDARQEAFVQATEAVRHAIVDFYERSGRAVHLDVVNPNRAIVIDGDIAVPGHPTVFTVGGAETLYLHWTTAASDVAVLLDVPSFEAITSGQSPSAECGLAAVTVGLGAADGVLAYIDDVPDGLGAGTRVPLGDSSPKQTWPWPITAAALVTTAGGVVLHRRDKIFGDRHSPVRDPSQTLLKASKPLLPVADLPPTKPRVIYLDDELTPEAPQPTVNPTARREIDLHAKRAESALTRSVEKAAAIQAGPLLGREDFARQINLEWSRRHRGGQDGAVASLALSELGAVRLRLGNHAADELFDEVADTIADLVRPLDVLGLAGENELAILMPEVDEDTARVALDTLAKKITAVRFTVGDDRVLLTPATGFAMLSDTETAPDLVRAIESAQALSMLNLDIDPERWDGHTTAPVATDSSNKSWAAIKEKLRTPAQIALTVVIAWVLPFFGYFAMEALGFDISFVIYVLVVSALVLTGMFILAEGMMAIKQKEPPEELTVPFPKASALIAAYLPNEAATVIETIESFLALDYPNEVQIILAYNTPDPLPVEEHLDRIAAEHPNFVPVRIVGSNSKAQNVNAALSMADGAFIGMFDADHQPRPDAFTRAWRWIDAGYDVVQGHCLTRNGDAGWLAKMIAVE